MTMPTEKIAEQMLALFRTKTDSYTRSKMTLIDAIAERCEVTANELYELTGSSPAMLVLFLALLDRPRPSMAPSDDAPLFSWAGDVLNLCDARLREVERRMREVPTARHCADRVAELYARLEEIAEDFANTDHNGNG